MDMDMDVSAGRLSLGSRSLQLTNLYFNANAYVACDQSLTELISHSPRLKVLYVDTLVDNERLQKRVMQLIHQHCPRLEWIYVCAQARLPVVTVMKETHRKTIDVAHISPSIDKEMLQVLKHHRTKVQVLNMSLPSTEPRHKTWSEIECLGGFPSLQCLRLCGLSLLSDVGQDAEGSRRMAATVVSIVQMCPTVETLSLECFDFSTTTDLFEALSNMKQLLRLEFTDCKGLKARDLHSFAKSGTALQHFAFRVSDEPRSARPTARDILEEASHMTELRALELRGYRAFGAEHIKRFANNLRSTRLARVIIEDCALGKAGLKHLLTLPNLVYVHIHGNYQMTEEDVGDAVLRSRNQSLCVVFQYRMYRALKDIFITDSEGMS